MSHVHPTPIGMSMQIIFQIKKKEEREFIFQIINIAICPNNNI